MLSNDIQERDGGETQRRRRGHFSPWTLEPCRVRTSAMWHAHGKNVRVSASGQVHSLHPPVACRAVATVWTRNPEKMTTANQQLGLLSCLEICDTKKKLRRRSGVDVDNFRLGVRYRAVSGSTS